MTKEGRTNGLKVGRFGPRVYYTLGPNRPTSSPSWLDPKNLELGWLAMRQSLNLSLALARKMEIYKPSSPNLVNGTRRNHCGA